MAIIDARTLPDASRIEADLIIIGGGMAGIALAKELAGGPLRVTILESGGLEIDADNQALYAGFGMQRAPGNPDRPFDDYPVQSRVRALGGSGMVWGGKCAPLDPADFAERPWIPYSGWPVTRAQMQPYYDRACDLLEIPRFPLDRPRPSGPERQPLALDPADGFFPAPREFSRFSGGVDKTAFDAFRTQFAEVPNIAVYLHANVTRIRREGLEIVGLDIACLNDHRHTAQAARYVLAVGGIENARLLLASDNLGNGHDLVGRFFQGHVTYSNDGDDQNEGTAIAISRATPMDLYAPDKGRTAHCVIGAGLPAQTRMKTGNFTATLFRVRASEPQTPVAADTVTISKTVARLARQGDGQLLGYFAMAEHFPNPDSRVTLDSDQKDALGMPRVRLTWAYGDKDYVDLERSVAGLADALGASGEGRLCWSLERSKLLGACSASRHHMGTTRMHADPAKGVVDPDLRLHEARNLYVTGSSVFPTSGIANPTLTLLALTIRLADHLKQETVR
ncbi:GMC oxidoreductase [Caulobacter sp. RL271]|jgi:choline dehydrogenase-like flavoprotein|uniref:GMC family oxidoreductase n=1 Tax=Caulobacter segnis TaxID=88688 RepID=A0ABY4ZMF6_9CAUL|nr:GMC family oxidoreductase [Caulobacter segnis]USQ93886.1 GMC family oxidoreductase [Caulobacter segnis]